MSSRDERIARNETLFREVNERIESISGRFGTTSDAEFVCECGRADCLEPVRMSVAEYEAVRSHATHFAVRPGHVAPDVERVVAERNGYVVVEKLPGEPARAAHETDPRA